MKHAPEYIAISKFYGDRTAKRSGVRLMNHIDEGLRILEQIAASESTKRAFCLHPLFQDDSEMTTVGREYLMSGQSSGFVIFLVMEYRQRANAMLSDSVYRARTGDAELTVDGLADPGPMPEIGMMLIADKVQNRKDFELYHKGSHERSEELDLYFQHWLEMLGVNEKIYRELVSAAERK